MVVWRCYSIDTPPNTIWHSLTKGFAFSGNEQGVHNLRNSFDKSSLMHYLCVFEQLYFQWNVYATNFNIAAGLASKIS